ncbi:hypothetical protein NA78x_000190 [Anatilimnocola sp. NA78]|uniref:hypothetical protein n=1 Tax=Anatilimnocola sp. NA78 TaxID=3415683 RepID=UPI003CE45F95
MTDELQFVLFSAVIPTITALFVALPLLRFAPQSVAGRCSLAIATAGAFFVGYVLLPDWAPLVPARHWHWLPHLAISGAVVGCLSVLVPLPAWGKYLLYLLLGLLGASQLVPQWDDLEPGRSVMIPLLAAYTALVSLLLALLPTRLRGKLFVVLLAATVMCSVPIIAVEGSLMMAQTAFLLVPSLIGCWLAMVLANRGKAQEPLSEESLGLATAGLIPVYALLSIGGAFVGAIEATERNYVLLLVPASPLVLWLFAFGPLARLVGWPAVIAKTIAVAVIPLAIIGYVLATALLAPESTDEWSLRLQSPSSAVFVASH